MNHIFIKHYQHTLSYRLHSHCDGWEYCGTASDEADFLSKVSQWEDDQFFPEDTGEVYDAMGGLIYSPLVQGIVDFQDYHYILVTEPNKQQQLAMEIK